MPVAMDPNRILVFGDFRLDTADERLWGAHGPVKLGHKAYDVLRMLAEQQGRLITKDALFSTVWDGTIVSESALTSVIKELRRALGDESRSPRYVESVYGRGYRFIAEVASAEGQPALSSMPAARHSAPEPRVQVGLPPSLHVPAFEILGGGDAHRASAAVVREEVLFALSRFRGVRIVSDASAETPSGADIGDRNYRLSVNLAHGRASNRAFARLSHLASQAIVWADSVELGNSDPAPDAELLVRRIAAAALPRLQDDLLARLPAQPRDIYDLYLQTKLRMRSQLSFAEAQEAADVWERMIDEHPQFTLAYPPLTRLYNTDYCYSGLGSTGEAERRRAYELAHQAFALDPTESHLHTVKGWSHLWAGEAALARQHLNEAVQLNSYDPSRLVEVATALMYLDDLDAAAELLERCRSLNPLSTDDPDEELGLLHLLRGEYETATDQLALVRRHHPDDRPGTALTIKGELYALLAALGASAPDMAQRSRHWRESVARRWCGPEPFDDARLKAWALYHNPFQDEGRRAWLAGLLDRALG